LRAQGTENPESAMVLPAILGFTLTNFQNRKTSQYQLVNRSNLQSRISDDE